MPGRTPLILDTNVVRHIGAGEVDPVGLYHFKDEGGTVQLGDSTISELTHQLVTGTLPWKQWEEARSHLLSLVPDNAPILPLHKAALFQNARGQKGRRTAKQLRDLEEYYDAGWTLLIAANNAEEIGGLEIRLAGEGAVMSLPEAHVAHQHRQVQEKWRQEFLSFRESMLALAPDLVQTMPRHDSREAFDAVLDARREKVDEGRRNLRPLASHRLDAYIRVKSLLQIRHLRPKDRYNAEKHANDYFDTELLRYLAIPAAVCTGDVRLVNLVDQSGSWQKPWVVSPSDLKERRIRDLLQKLQWPTA